MRFVHRGLYVLSCRSCCFACDLAMITEKSFHPFGCTLYVFFAALVHMDAMMS